MVGLGGANTFSDTARVKADPGRHPKHDEVPVMKLNLATLTAIKVGQFKGCPPA